ncbi:MCP1 Mitochondrial adapter protein MCP1 [Candida maltosa Xu316]
MSNSDSLAKVVPIPLDTIDDPSPIVPQKKSWLVPTLYRIQKYSAYSFISFLGIHVTSVIIVPILPIDQTIKDEIFSMGKAIYQSVPLYEPIFIIGSVSAHLLSGISLRIYKKFFTKKNNSTTSKTKSVDSPVRRLNDHDDEIGFGGLANLFGLGYRKSFTLKFGLTPLQFSGYLLVPFLLYHFYKFRYLPLINDDDSSLINLEYISYVLNLKHPAWNVLALSSLVWIMSYHATNGMLKLQSKYSPYWKKIGLGIVNGLGVLGMFAVYLFKSNSEIIDINGFLGKSFKKYIDSYWL